MAEDKIAHRRGEGKRERRHKDQLTRVLSIVLGDGLLTSEGEPWRRRRRLAQPAFHRERIAAYAAEMVTQTERRIGAWRDGEVRDVHADLMGLTLDIVAATLFGADIEPGEAGGVSSAIESLMSYFARPVNIAFPRLARLLAGRQRRLHQAIARLDAILYGIIARRRARPRPEAGDLLSLLLAARDEDGSGMSDREVRDEAMTIFLAGHETTALALSWTFYLLGRHPAVEARLAAELRDSLGGRAPGMADLPSLRYAEQVLHEAMRLYPPAWAIGREAIEPVTIGGYRLPRGAQIWICQYIVHRDPRFFPDPDAFRPERWEDGLERRLPRFAYFPFGGGPRVCIGNAFAMMEATLLLATMARRFRLELVPGHRVEAFPTVTLRPRYGVRVRLSARR